MAARPLEPALIEKILATVARIASERPDLPIIAHGTRNAVAALAKRQLIDASGESPSTWEARFSNVRSTYPERWETAAGGEYALPSTAQRAATDEALIAGWDNASHGALLAAASLGMGVDQFRRELRLAQERQRIASISPNGRDGFVVREATTAFNADGDVTGEWLREGPAPTTAPGGIDEGPARDGGPGYIVKGVSTYFDGAGQVRGQWVKTKVEDQQRDLIWRAAAEEMAEGVTRAAPVSGPPSSMVRLANFITFTDYHLGMLAWKPETGADWNLQIAEDLLVKAYSHLVQSAPPAQVAVLNIQGDFLHSDGLLPVTPTNHHVLDQDGRYAGIVKSCIRVLRRLCSMALAKHAEVHLIIAEGNHDLAGSLWLRHMLGALYENEPRLTVNQSEVPYYVFEWGQTMLGVHHGHMKKNDSLPLLFAARYSDVWGRTTKRYIHTGHRHHEEVKEHPGVRVIQHPTLAAPDAYAARGGWMSERQASLITYHDRFGKVGEIVVTPEMVGA